MAKRLTAGPDGVAGAEVLSLVTRCPIGRRDLAQSRRMVRRRTVDPWRSAGQLSERQASGDDVVRTTGWVFNNETGSDLTLEQFVATGDDEVPAYLTVFGLRGRRTSTSRRSSRSAAASVG